MGNGHGEHGELEPLARQQIADNGRDPKSSNASTTDGNTSHQTAVLGEPLRGQSERGKVGQTASETVEDTLGEVELPNLGCECSSSEGEGHDDDTDEGRLTMTEIVADGAGEGAGEIEGHDGEGTDPCQLECRGRSLEFLCEVVILLSKAGMKRMGYKVEYDCHGYREKSMYMWTCV